MRILKKISKLEQQNVDMALQIVELKKELDGLLTWRTSFKKIEKEVAEIKERLPEYEDAVARGVDDVWNKAVQSIIDFNPLRSTDGGDA